MTNMNSQSNEIFGIRRSTILIISIALAIGGFSAWKAVGGGSATAARISVSGTALAAGGDKSPSAVAGLQTEPHSSTVRSPAALTTSSLGTAILTKADAVAADHPGSVMAGLPTEPYAAVRTTLTPIEQIQVGDRVLAESPTGEEDTTFGSEIIPSDWRKLTLRAPKRDGTVAEVVLLRPLTWLNEQHGEVGGTVFISVPECGIDGNANVLAIDPCPEIPKVAVSLREMSLDLSRRFKSATGCLPDSMEAQQDSLARSSGPVHTARHVSAERDGYFGRVVTGTFLHQASSTITLTITGQSEPIECTGNHPFWSEDRQTFVRADSLQRNESLRTATGLTTVESWTPDLNPTPVYNIEVHGAHVYHVGTSGVVVHNGTPCSLDEILFGQKRIAERFRDYGPNPLLAGRSVLDVANDLKLGTLTPDDIEIFVFRYKGRLYAESNRGLAALSLAGKRPTVVTEILNPASALTDRVDEMLDVGRGGLVIPVTAFKDGTGELFTVFLPILGPGQ